MLANETRFENGSYNNSRGARGLNFNNLAFQSPDNIVSLVNLDLERIQLTRGSKLELDEVLRTCESALMRCFWQPDKFVGVGNFSGHRWTWWEPGSSHFKLLRALDQLLSSVKKLFWTEQC